MEQLANSIQSISFEQLAQKIITVDDSMRGVAVKTINQATTLRNWIIGCYIVEYEQNGSDRAKYGDNLLKSLEKRIGQKGLNVTLFQLSRLFYRDYPHIGTLVSANHATALHKLPLSEIYATVSHKLPEIDSFAVNKKNAGKLSEQFNTPPENLVSALSFSHIRELLTIEDPLVRFFYETECIRGTWSVRELRRQIVSNLHIRIGLSEDKMKAMMLADSKAERHTPLLQIRDPYTFEFLGLQAKDVVTESDIEEALLGHLQEFLLELGKGFCFEARQKRIIIDGEYYFADLVFYNRLLHCNVIVELLCCAQHNKSVRELSGQKIVKELTGREIPVVCDPTILFAAEEWDGITKKEHFVKEPYLFCYFLGNNPEQRDFVKRFKEKTGYKIVQLQHCDEYIKSDVGFPDYTPYNVGPAEFVQLIRDAEYVFTDSFHSSVFSLLYGKRFFTFRRYNNDGIVSTNGRLYSLLSLVGLEERLLKADEDVEKCMLMQIDYIKIHRKLETLREFTKQYIKEALFQSGINYDNY